MTNPRRKGSKFERDVAKILSEWSGIELTRTPRSGGMAESFPADVMPKDRLERFAFMVECKHQEGWSVDALIRLWPDYKLVQSWWDQCMSARHYCGRFYIPLLLIKKNRYPVLAMLRTCDLPSFHIPVLNYIILDRARQVVVMLLSEFMECYDYADF